MRRHFLCTVLTVAVLVSCLGGNVAAAKEVNNVAELISVYASGRFSMEVAAKTTIKANTSFPLEIGEVVTIKASYSPFNASVDFGLIAPDGLFYGLNTTTGSFDKPIKVTQRGYYTLAVRNNSSDVIHVSGYVNY